MYNAPTVPAGSGLAVVIVGAIGAALMVRLKLFVDESPSFPVTRTVKLAVVAALGVPLTTPPLLRLKPDGRLPDAMDQVYGVVPPVAANPWLYATPTVPAGSGLAVVIVGAVGAALIVRLKLFVDESPSFPVTRTVKLAVVAALGVPLTTPPLLRLKPDGRLPDAMDQEYGVMPPVAANAWLYATPTAPTGSGLPVVIVGAVGAALMVRLNVLVDDSPLLPVTRTVKLAVVATLGVPVITPPLLRLKPDGRLPEEIDQV